jgi:hypothetical protein
MMFSGIFACCTEIFAFSFFFHQTLADAEMLDKNIGLPLVDTSTSQVPEVFRKPDSIG